MLVGSKGERLRVAVNAVICVALVTGDGSRVYEHQKTRSKRLVWEVNKAFYSTGRKITTLA